MARAAGFATAVTSRRGVLTNANLTGLTSLPRVPINGWYQQPAMIDALVSGLPMALATRASQKNASSCRSGALEGKAASQSW